MSRHTVDRYMSPAPIVIASDRTLAEAHEAMRAHHVRHLPVVDDGRLVGIVSLRDLYLLETLRSVDSACDTVREAMSGEPYTTAPDAPLDEVARVMADRKYGAAVVVSQGKVVGVFTTVDALRALATVLQRGRAAAPSRLGTDPV